jgi:hypothetical protein
MDVIAISLAALIVPVLWGCGSHWLLERFWPRRNGRARADLRPSPAPPADCLDFQI